ncbi:MAG TPA: pyridoxamine 5'-phosphate oxidase family protein [Candidatus Limnocylindrales bacterium]|jgi:PPOX class probable F420-dependent enzyme
MSTTTAASASRARRFLEAEAVIWLATVDGSGRPALVPVWFWWDGEAILVASKPDARKVRNIRNNARVMLALGNPDDDFDVGLIEAHAELVEVPVRSVLVAGLATKYETRMRAIGLTATEFASTYQQVIRISPIRPLAWQGRTRSVAESGPAGGMLEPLRRSLRGLVMGMLGPGRRAGAG